MQSKNYPGLKFSFDLVFSEIDCGNIVIHKDLDFVIENIVKPLK